MTDDETKIDGVTKRLYNKAEVKMDTAFSTAQQDFYAVCINGIYNCGKVRINLASCASNKKYDANENLISFDIDPNRLVDMAVEQFKEGCRAEYRKREIDTFMRDLNSAIEAVEPFMEFQQELEQGREE